MRGGSEQGKTLHNETPEEERNKYKPEQELPSQDAGKVKENQPNALNECDARKQGKHQQ